MIRSALSGATHLGVLCLLHFSFQAELYFIRLWFLKRKAKMLLISVQFPFEFKITCQDFSFQRRAFNGLLLNNLEHFFQSNLGNIILRKVHRKFQRVMLLFPLFVFICRFFNINCHFSRGDGPELCKGFPFASRL